MVNVDCVFCKIVKKELDANIVYEDDRVLAFLDIRPRNQGHTLVISKPHYKNIFEIPEEEIGYLYKIVKRIAIAVKKAVNADGINTIQSNEVAQGVHHFHTHVLPRFWNDGIPIVWESNEQMGEKELNDIANKIKKTLK